MRELYGIFRKYQVPKSDSFLLLFLPIQLPFPGQEQIQQYRFLLLKPQLRPFILMASVTTKP